MATTVSMPQLGETVTEGTILKWAKQVGDTIGEDEVLVEISTDKVDTEVPSPVGGTILEILVSEGDTVEVGVDLVVIGTADELSSPQEQPTSSPQEESDVAVEPSSSPQVEPSFSPQDEASSSRQVEPSFSPQERSEVGGSTGVAGEGGDLPPASETPVGPGTGFEPSFSPQERSDVGGSTGVAGEGGDTPPSDDDIEAFFAEPSDSEAAPQLLSPVVRRLVRENQIDIAQIQGSGQGGRITRKDVDAYLEEGPPVESTPVVEPEPEPVVETTPLPVSKPEPAPVAPPASDSETVELDRLRIRIAENNVRAKATAAHVWTSVEVDFERVERVRQTNKAEFKSTEGFSLTYLPFISRATIDALKEFPVVNSSFNLEEKTATFHKKVDLGIAIDLNQGGLVVARVRDADGLRLVGIAREIRDLATQGRSGDLGVDDVTGSTFTITNPGPFGSFMSAPIINVPNVAILSTDTVTKRPTVITSPDGQDMIAIRHIGYSGIQFQRPTLLGLICRR